MTELELTEEFKQLELFKEKHKLSDEEIIRLFQLMPEIVKRYLEIIELVKQIKNCSNEH